jgi:uncharacterized membrane protein YeaQ/YmgE (transglycosylase-associated protein family)
VTYAFTADYPNYSALSDAEILAAASLPNGTLAVGELLAGSSANNGALTLASGATTTANNGINLTSILVAFVGAVILIALLRLVSGRRR